MITQVLFLPQHSIRTTVIYKQKVAHCIFYPFLVTLLFMLWNVGEVLFSLMLEQLQKVALMYDSINVMTVGQNNAV